MLQLKNIVKTYVAGDTKQDALKGVSMNFRENEFVSILGQSGSGKTTLLNIIGGLDRYTSGDLIINGVSTSKYKDADWDYYRNHSMVIGEKIKFIQNGEATLATATAIDEKGGLEVELENGEKTVLRSGEITVRKV